jgi:hypothetical protein
MKFGILREKESTRQKSCFHRWIATYKERYEDAFIQVESSDIRIFTDAQYRDLELKFQMTSVIVMFYLELKKFL